MKNIIHLKNMVCPRCIMAVQEILDKMEIPYKSVRLGEITLTEELMGEVKKDLKSRLEKIGFTLINDRKSQLIEQMKSLVIEKLHHSNNPININWAEYISNKLHLDYKYASSLFSSIESITFEQYIIHQKIERVKELIVYDEMSLSEISYQLDYSSVAYLSNQFKKITGMTSTHFKNSLVKNRKFLDEI
ncbi:helix-turn-helix domain-containing protein [Maribacter polysaccharolyticus]|uniref:helix-turn-helix domain-containing protein n=1 Tax=Maribacter polysaccharolyticus TaxID=3020831 RepID=UPI00237FA7D6|nr:AraC family transcriptional regulator [Maribacter polysaccharolyticus]MDE3741062.1 AraC family transcriptional regulator [Maribacter polysaccharolyticus]